MTDDLRSTIENIFNPSYACCSANSRWGGSSRTDLIKYLEIPITNKVFYVPMLAFDTFIKKIHPDNPKSIVVKLKCLNLSSRYKSLNRIMQDMLKERFAASRLVKVPVTQGDYRAIYFATQGAVFDESFHPVMMCSWKVERLFDLEEEFRFKYKLLKPVIWIHPSLYMNKTDPMAKFICNTIVPHIMSQGVGMLGINYLGSNFVQSDVSRTEPRIVIDEFPLTIRNMKNPDATTTNEELLQTVINHIEEIIQ